MKKSIMHICMFGFLVALFLPLQAFAQSGDSFRLDQSGLVTLESSHAAKEGISSFCFSMTVVPEDASATVEFEFASDNAEIIMEYHYNADKNRLNVYMAGTTPLFQTESPLSIGWVVVVPGGSGNNKKAMVEIDEKSLQYVYGSEAKTMKEVDVPPEKMQIGSDDTPGSVTPSVPTPAPAPTETPEPVGTPEPVVTPKPTETPEPAATQAPSNPQGSSSEGSGSGGTQPAGGQSGSGQNSAAPTSRPGGTQVGSTQGTGKGQGGNAQGSGSTQGNVAQESSSAQESDGEDDDTQVPEESSSEPVESSEEEMNPASAESGQEEESLPKGESGFWKELKPVLTGVGIGALLLGIGAVVVVLLIKTPKRK